VGIVPSLREKKSISILAALQSGAKEHADKRKIKARIRGQNMESLMGGFPLFTTHLWAKYGAKYVTLLRRKKTAHMESTRWHVGLRAGALNLTLTLRLRWCY
jgi:hypothetical protein